MAQLLMLCSSLRYNEIGEVGATKIGESLAANITLTWLK